MLKKYCLLIFFFYLFNNNLTGRDFKALYHKSLGPTLIKNTSATKSSNNMPFNRNLNKVVYGGSIKIKKQFLENTPIRIYYKGDVIPCQNGIYQFFSEENNHKIQLLIGLIDRPKNTTIKYLKVPKKVDYIFYTLERLTDKNKCSWVINETRGNDGLNVPENALIAHINAQFVERLSTKQWEHNTSPIPFPTLILKKNIINLQEQTDKALLEALHIDPFHKKLSTTIKINDQKSSILQAQEINL